MAGSSSRSSRQQRKRKASSSNTTNNTNMWSSSGGRKSKKKNAGGNGSSSVEMNEDLAEKLFTDLLADQDDEHVATLTGISKLCEELGVDAVEDIRVLVLLWKLGANDKPAQISKDEWMQGCSKLQLDSIAKFKAFLPSLETGFLDQTEFKDFYKFCFQFNREGTYRTLDKDMVVELLKLVLKGRSIPNGRLDSFCAFVESQTQYTRITLDQWTSFLDFCYDVEDLSMYDESTSAWPVLIDDFVEYIKEQQKK